MLAFVNHASEGWQKFDITPTAGKGRKIVDFDVAQVGTDVHVAVAIPSVPSKKGAEGSHENEELTHSLWHCSFPIFQLSASQSEKTVVGFATDSELIQPHAKRTNTPDR